MSKELVFLVISRLAIFQRIVASLFPTSKRCKLACDQLTIDATDLNFLYDFQEMTGSSFPYEEMAKGIFALLHSKEALTEKEFFLYKCWGYLAFTLAPMSVEFFEEFFEFANEYQELQKIRENLPVALSIPQLEFLVQLVGKQYKNVDLLAGVSSGDRTSWDAANFARSKINALSSSPEVESSNALIRLLQVRSLLHLQASNLQNL